MIFPAPMRSECAILGRWESASMSLQNAVKVPRSRVNDIVLGRRAVTIGHRPAAARVRWPRVSTCIDLLGEPGFDQRLIGHIPFVGCDLDALEQSHRQPERDRYCRWSEIG